jgi:hypothetical protein
MTSPKKPKNPKSPKDPKQSQSSEPCPEGSKGSQPDYHGHEGNGQDSFDDPEEHRKIERRRFHGGLPATPEMYARAREQWYRLPGSLVRPTMDPVVGDAAPDEQHPPGQAQPDEKRGER